MLVSGRQSAVKFVIMSPQRASPPFHTSDNSREFSKGAISKFPNKIILAKSWYTWFAKERVQKKTKKSEK